MIHALVWLVVLLAALSPFTPVVRGERDGHRITVIAEHLPPGASFEVTIDRAQPHASIACRRQRTRIARTDARGELRVRFSGRGACRLGEDADGWLAFVEQRGGALELRSSAFP